MPPPSPGGIDNDREDDYLERCIADYLPLPTPGEDACD